MKKSVFKAGKYKWLYILSLYLIVSFGVINCSITTSENGDETPATHSSTKDITAFSFNAADNTALLADETGSISGTNITATVPFGTEVNALVPAITHTGVSVSPDSGSAQDFTNPVTYTVTAADASAKEYTITVTIAVDPKTFKDITAFSFNAADNTALSADETGSISGTNITATVPFGTEVNALVPAITHTGVSVSPDSGSAQDFTNPVTYTVTAADASEKVYTVTVTTPVAEGSFSTPIDISAAFPISRPSSTVDTNYSFYQVDVTSGNNYTFSITGMTDDVNLMVFSDSSFSNFVCGSWLIGTADESCSYTAGVTTLYIMVDGTSTGGGAVFTLGVVENGAVLPAEGSFSTPIDISAAFPISRPSSTVDTNYSYYQVTVTSGNNYTFSITGMTDDVNLIVFSDSSFSNFVCGSWLIGTADESCSYTAGVTTLYIMVDGTSTGGGAVFTLGVVENGAALPGEGSFSTPLDISAAFPISRPSSTVDTSYSFYQVTVTSGNNYTFSITSMTDDVNLMVFSDSSFSNFVCGSWLIGTDDESCSTTATVTTLYIVVDGTSTGGGAVFTLGVVDNGVAPPQYVFETVGAANTTNADTMLAVFESDGTTPVTGCSGDISTAYDDQSGVGNYSKVDCPQSAFTSGNTYYLAVTPFSSSSGDYRMTWRDNTVEVLTCADSIVDPDTGTGADAADPGDDVIGGAVTISLNCSNGLDRMNLSGTDDYDWFRITAP